MNSTFISSLRRATVSSLAARLFLNENPETIVILGAGAQAAMQLQVFACTMPTLKRAYIYDVDPQRSDSLRKQMSGVIDITISQSAREAVELSTLVIPLTTVTEGYIQFDWLRPGSVVINVSWDDVLPDVVFRAEKVVVDDWSFVKADDKRLLARLFRAGKVAVPYDENVPPGTRRVDGELGGPLTTGTIPANEPGGHYIGQSIRHVPA